jgi:hypothetical protein
VRRKAKPELLGIHGIVFRSADPPADARRWTEITGLEPLRRTRREIVLGGPELFVVVRKATPRSVEGLEEVHLAVEDIGVTRRKASPDPLGGDSWKKRLSGFDLVMRQFRRPPARIWRRKRR